MLLLKQSNQTMSSTTTTQSKLETPFTTAVRNTDVAFWRRYIAGRPAPTAAFYDLINEYHASHSDGRTVVAHDVGTGPGNIAQKLLSHYDRVVGSDVNDKALTAASLLASPEHLERLTFVNCPAEDLATAPIPSAVGVGHTDLVVVSECMPLLDAPRALRAFHSLLRPGGTLAAYFYGRPIFVDDDADALNAAYETLATRVCSFLLPFKGTPGFPFHQRGAEGLASYLDNIALPAGEWGAVERRKWNCDHPLLFNGVEGFDFEVVPVDRRGPEETERRVVDRGFWAEEWDAERVEAYLLSVYPGAREKAGERYQELEGLLTDLRKRMGGGVRKVTFSAVLIMATRK
jgi:SAM-dependent methyltransferase